MSMLAGPRRKQKVINLRAKNNAWSNDTNKFGQKMLEKMGWSAGKGLGAKENGIVEHVVAKYKNDEKGLGFEDKNDQWTKHEDDFNALLANLSNSESNAEVLHSGISLEDKSKKSKARIHYHKFTRGKDLSKYSEKDLANIFGKKSFKETEEEEILRDDVTTSEQVFTEKGSMDDYFKNKLASLKSKSKLLNSFNGEKKAEDVSDYSFKGFSNDTESTHEITTNGFGHQPFSFYHNKTETSNNNLDDVDKTKTKKKKKSKNREENCDNILSFESVTNNESETVEQQEIKSKKSKKKKYQEMYEETDQCELAKKKSKNRNRDCENEQEQCTESDVPKKKKKRKNKEYE
ncbi:PIN2/TERF1-interacting telomerase inhibitor 1 [Melitaea cinxia]|uniref:PIN2/TERF1-interacting telomerase inhibitor 1 n=1 Tax=Melitaea cinxia TaxID=113334 RepID=UPI001E271B34|nr:PIN2/TERF1-interacting telomerase inhibitor 1 [Melitaea cinxia]